MSGQPPIPAPGLPPVQPPTGQMILRLFLVPFLIVGVLIGLYLLGQLFFGPGARRHSVDQYLKNLDSPNPDIRWRAASDLSQELPRSPEMARDATFALELAGRLDRALAESARLEAEHLQRAAAGTEKEAGPTRELTINRDLIMYLAASLGNFQVPAGTPLLCRMAGQTTGMEAEALAQRRSRALFALAVLGDQLRKYDASSDDQKEQIDQELQAVTRESLVALASQCRAYLEQRRAGQASSFGVAAVLLQCGEDDDPYLRELAALVSNFWTGTPAEVRQVDALLARLALDDGRGQDRLDELLQRNPEARRSRALCKRPGFQVQVNANLALARRGSDRVRLVLLADQLDPALLRELFVRRLTQRDGEREEPNEALVVVTLTSTLQALAELHRQRPTFDLAPLRERIEQLTHDDNPAIRIEAEKTRRALTES
ncbi:MAG: hypothetical protein U0840_09820 [Gemmataceae bacterium]